MRKLSLTLALLALSTPALADGYASAQAQAGVGYATPQAALVPQYAPQDTIIERQEVYTAQPPVVRERQVTEYVPRTYVVREEIPVAPTRTIIQREVSYAPARATGCYGAGAALRQRSFAPVAYDDIPVGAGALATATSYGGGRAAALRGQGFRQRAPRAQKTVSRSRAVTVERPAGFRPVRNFLGL